MPSVLATMQSARSSALCTRKLSGGAQGATMTEECGAHACVGLVQLRQLHDALLYPQWRPKACRPRGFWTFEWGRSRPRGGRRFLCRRRLLMLELQPVEQREPAALAQQFVVAPRLDQIAVFDHQDAVGMHDGGEPVRDDECSAALAEL